MKSFINSLPFGLGGLIIFVLKSVRGYGHLYYSQNGEDIILKSFFRKKEKGFYVDIGAHHPKRYSNTYLLYKKGWQGINIDANPKSIKEFNRARPRDINIEAGIGDDTTILKYFLFEDSAVNTFTKEEAEKWKASSWNKYLGSRRIKMSSINSILEKNLPITKDIDLLSVDVEGLDLIVLKSLDWKKYKPLVVVVEDNNFDFSDVKASEIYTLLSDKGYKLYSVVKFSLIFVKKNKK